MYSPYIRIEGPSLAFPKDTNRLLRSGLHGVRNAWLVPMLILHLFAIYSSRASAQVEAPASDRITVNLSQGVPNFVGNASLTDPTAALPQSNWWYENNQDSSPTSSSFAAPSYVETATPVADSGPACGSTLSTPNWTQVGIPTGSRERFNIAPIRRPLGLIWPNVSSSAWRYV
jgi:hypothetical protein